MSTLTVSSAPSTTQRRSVRTVVFIVLFVVVAGALLAVLTTGGPKQLAPLDPTNPEAKGAKAVAQVLEQQGVAVTVVRSADALEDEPVDADTTVVVTSADELGNTTSARLREHTRVGRLIVVDPSPGTSTALGLDVEPYGVSIDEPRQGDCADPRYTDLELDADVGTEYSLPDGCFSGDNGVLLGTTTEGITLLGAPQILTNSEILRGDNAAISLILLGSGGRLIWYIPTLEDLPSDDTVTLSTLLPDWLRPGLWLAGVATIAVILWRGRRLGPLVSEPTPVEVKAIETTLSRGRLYRKANDRGHAAAALRAAARERLRLRLHLPTRTAPDVLTRHLADRLHQSVESVADAIAADAPDPTTDQQLIALANRLAELDEEVLRS